MHPGARAGGRGQGVVEYVLVALVIGLIALFAVSRFGEGTSSRYDCSSKTPGTAKISGGESPVQPGCDEQQEAAAQPPPPPDPPAPELPPAPPFVAAPPPPPPPLVAVPTRASCQCAANPSLASDEELRSSCVAGCAGFHGGGASDYQCRPDPNQANSVICERISYAPSAYPRASRDHPYVEPSRDRGGDFLASRTLRTLLHELDAAAHPEGRLGCRLWLIRRPSGFDPRAPFEVLAGGLRWKR